MKTLNLNEDKKVNKKRDDPNGSKRSRKKTSENIQPVAADLLLSKSIIPTPELPKVVNPPAPPPPPPPVPVISYSTVLLEPTRQLNGHQKPNQHNSNTNLHRDLFVDSSQSLDPFNDCELKTINDLEELKTILQLHQQQQQQQQHQQQFSNIKTATATTTTPVPVTSQSCAVDSFGLPIVADLDINSNKI